MATTFKRKEERSTILTSVEQWLLLGLAGVTLVTSMMLFFMRNH